MDVLEVNEASNNGENSLKSNVFLRYDSDLKNGRFRFSSSKSEHGTSVTPNNVKPLESAQCKVTSWLNICSSSQGYNLANNEPANPPEFYRIMDSFSDDNRHTILERTDFNKEKSEPPVELINREISKTPRASIDSNISGDSKKNKIATIVPPLSPESRKKNELCAYLKLMDSKQVAVECGNIYTNRRSIRVKNLLILSERRELEKKLIVKDDFDDYNDLLSRKSFEELNMKIIPVAKELFPTFHPKYVPKHVMERIDDFERSIMPLIKNAKNANKSNKENMRVSRLKMLKKRIVPKSKNLNGSLKNLDGSLKHNNSFKNANRTPNRILRSTKKKIDNISVMYRRAKIKLQRKKFDRKEERKQNMRLIIKKRVNAKEKNKAIIKKEKLKEVCVLLTKDDKLLEKKLSSEEIRQKVCEDKENGKAQIIKTRRSLMEESTNLLKSFKSTEDSINKTSMSKIEFKSKNIVESKTEINFQAKIMEQGVNAHHNNLIDHNHESEESNAVQLINNPEFLKEFMSCDDELSEDSISKELCSNLDELSNDSESIKNLIVQNEHNYTLPYVKINNSNLTPEHRKALLESPEILKKTFNYMKNNLEKKLKEPETPIILNNDILDAIKEVILEDKIEEKVKPNGKIDLNEIADIIGINIPARNNEASCSAPVQLNEVDSLGLNYKRKYNITENDDNKRYKLLDNCVSSSNEHVEVIPVKKDAVKSLHNNLTQKKKLRKNASFSEAWDKTKKSPHTISVLEENGDIVNAHYFDYNLVITQEHMVSFWTQSALGFMLQAQDMWVPKGTIQRLSLDSGCVHRSSQECVISSDNSFAYVELWTKEHKSDKRERPVADVFAVIYFSKTRQAGLDKKVLQLENINGFADDVRYVVSKNSNNVLVSWRTFKDDTSLSMLHCYQLGSDYQTIINVQELESVDHVISTLHNIEDCDTLVMGCGEQKVTIWNLEFGYIVATIDILEALPEPTNLWVKCDRGFLFTLQQFPDGILRLLAINGITHTWKRLQSYNPPEGYNKLSGVCIENGILICFYSNGLLCWNIQSGDLLLEEHGIDTKYLPSGKHILIVSADQVQVRNALSHLITNYDFNEI